jgi:hypothetical protein
MTQNIDINRIIDQAKTRRAETIGSALQAYTAPAVLIAGLSILLLQFTANPPTHPVDPTVGLAQVASVDH